MARALRRPVKLSEMFPDSQLKEVTALLGDDNEHLRSLKELVADERYRERQQGGWGRPNGSPQ
jgi:methyl coenzyme M reductase gamma subunit